MVPTPPAPLIDGSAAVAGSWQGMGIVIAELAIFLVVALGFTYGGRVLAWAVKFGVKDAAIDTSAEGEPRRSNRNMRLTGHNHLTKDNRSVPKRYRTESLGMRPFRKRGR